MKYLVVLGTLFFTSMGAKSQNNHVQVREIEGVAAFEPGSSISIIEKGSKRIWSDSLSMVAKTLQLEILKKYAEKFNISGSISIADSLVQHSVMKEVYSLQNESLKHPKKLANIKLTPIIDSLLTASNHRFGLFVVNDGFTRTKENYKSQKEMNIAVDVLSLGSTISTSYKMGSRVFVIIVDDQYKNVAFFSQLMEYNKDPLDEHVLDEQFQKILDAYVKAREN